ncbi:MAG: hypothetical protein CM1200mP40_33420 [Gammaproteobacteria bacterium]|nr:MAG: hypothetical protein CM1200mP40_33420 [Gammaproteobacteria bacterium]
MPTEDPGSLTQQSYAAILAYILKSNEFPSGDTDLASNAEVFGWDTNYISIANKPRSHWSDREMKDNNAEAEQ